MSLATTVNVTVCVFDDVLSSTEVSFAVKLLIAGFWSSVLLTTISIVSVLLLPAVSVTVAVNVSLVLPKL